jgi:uncharacterized protein YjbJ (UPF0337 family)
VLSIAKKEKTMANQQTLEGSWNQLKGKLREKWGQLTEDDLAEAQGRMDRLAGIIHRKTGEGREAIEQYLREVGGSATSTLSAVASEARQYAGQVAESVSEMGKQTADQIRSGYNEAQRLVRDRPGASLGVCFGAGVLIGVLIALAIRER